MIRQESLWTLRHFWKPRQASPLRLKPLLDLARLQGMLSPLPEGPIRVDARQIPGYFLGRSRDHNCASMGCRACGHCERIACSVFETGGSMSSPSVLFVLREILDSGLPQPGQKGMLLAFGAGFSAFAALMEFASA